jgi:eukaryotic-like serine/threonine-protein kinase
MLVGQQFGPFQIEKELGSGAMGAVYRAVYIKTGQKVAIKVMLPGMGDNEQAQKRFEREADILKQLKHPNIVRYLGSGKIHKMRFCAMEYLEGEPLDRVLARRGRLTWEEVVAIGRQLCSALQHAHLQGVVHRDLKPSNLMLQPDGTLKLTDFGIAKDLDVTQLTSANCTVGTASYMSPEQCKGERNLTHKSDLYSLGIVLYELLTGRKPFVAENVMDMFMAHVQGKFERPSRQVLDIPKWLDTLVCQLLEKLPEQRPFDADMVGNALEQVMEKVEAQQSAGVDAARARVIDRPRGEARLNDEDRQLAQSLLSGGKKKKKKKFVKVPVYQRGWFQAVALVCLLAAVGGTLYLLLRPESESSLYARIEKRMGSNDPAEMKKVFDGPDSPGQTYLTRFGSRDDEHVRKVREWDRNVGVLLAEEELAEIRKAVKRHKALKNASDEEALASMDALTEAGKKAFLASQAEDQGDLTEAGRLWQQVEKASGSASRHWDELARWRVNIQYPALNALSQSLDRHFAWMREFGRQPTVEPELERKAFLALRYERFGDFHEAHRLWAALKDELQDKPQERAWFLLAAQHAHQAKEGFFRGFDEKGAREKAVNSRLKEAEDFEQKDRLRDAELICLDFEALYADHPEFKVDTQVAEAKKVYNKIRAKRK